MKKIRVLLLGLIVLSMLSIGKAQQPPLPGGGGNPGNNNPVGGGSPIGGGLAIMVALALGYGTIRYKDAGKEKSDRNTP